MGPWKNASPIMKPTVALALCCGCKKAKEAEKFSPFSGRNTNEIRWVSTSVSEGK